MFLGTWNIYSKIVMIVVVYTSLIKTFYFMKIVQQFSYIVTMITSVIVDLRIFLLFFVVLILNFSMVFDVISRNNSDEYRKVGPYVGNLLSTLRLSLGDFDFSLIEDKELTKQHVLFWVTWVIMVIFSSLIFLNFIIAEVSNSYQKVKESIDSQIYKERATLVAEAEDIISKQVQVSDKSKFPRYIISREQEE